MNYKVVALFFGLWQISAHAQVQPDYRCTIERIHGAFSDDAPSLDFERRMLLGKEFTVDRQSGLMVGALKNSYATKPSVIDVGSTENSFKAVTTMRKDQGFGAGSNVFVLVIDEFEKGAKKPFAFLSNDLAYFGTCHHFR